MREELLPNCVDIRTIACRVNRVWYEKKNGDLWVGWRVAPFGRWVFEEVYYE